MQFDKDKAINALLFIAQGIADSRGLADKYATLKILYFAEKKHLVEYGRLITDDKFAALKFGPVPSNSYDLLEYNNEYFNSVDNKNLKPLILPDLKMLSNSDVECLRSALEENKGLGFNELKIKSHDAAYHKAFDNSIQWLSLEDIAEQEGATKDLIGYIKEHYDILNYSKCVQK
ncbi:MAG: Panacea domain-containing protein [Pedobacter sp.]|nr:Panacea domain-containing protein [Pedobacter sp.]